MNDGNATTITVRSRTTQTVAADCLTCGAHRRVKVPAAGWHAWKTGEITAHQALRTVHAPERRWITQGLCPDCWAHTVRQDTTTTYFDTQCPGCNRWESFGVAQAALQAYRTGELSEHQAFPHHSTNERDMIELGWHGACFDNAANRPNDGTHQ